MNRMRYVTIVLSLTAKSVRLPRKQQTQGDGTDSRVVFDDALVAPQEAIQYLNLLDDGLVCDPVGVVFLNHG